MGIALRLLALAVAPVLCSCTSATVGSSFDRATGPALQSFGYSPTGDPGSPELATTRRIGALSTVRRTVLRNTGAIAGENFVSVETRGSAGTRPDLLRPPTVEILRNEMRAAVPGVSMRILAMPVQGRGGLLGIATGSSSGGSCVYAWRWHDRSEDRGGVFKRRDPLGLRIRLCGDASTKALLRTVLALEAAEAEGVDAPDGWSGNGDDALSLAAQAMGIEMQPLPQATGNPPRAAERAPARRYAKAAKQPRVAMTAAPSSASPRIPLPDTTRLASVEESPAAGPTSQPPPNVSAPHIPPPPDGNL